MSKYDIAAIIWPSYTGDEPRTRIFWPEGYVNEANPDVMEMQINCALSHGVNTFIYDWYWYDNRPFLENCLNDGFLKAANNKKMKFYLMWANHDAAHLWDKRNSDEVSEVIWSAVVTPEIFSNITDRTVEKYFKRENYYCIDGCPVYMIFEIDNLIRSFGTTQALKKGLDEFREKTVRAGFNGLHLQCVMWSGRIYNWLRDGDACKGKTLFEVLEYLGFDSVTNYNWGGSLTLDGDYNSLSDEYIGKITEDSKKFTFYPNITIGWDNNVRFKKFIPGVVKNNTPENFKRTCRMIKDFTDEKLASGQLAAPLITVNSWNEWTETSYLEPDDLYGYAYLEAIGDVFGSIG